MGKVEIMTLHKAEHMTKQVDGLSFRVNYHKNRDVCSITVYGGMPEDIRRYVHDVEWLNQANEICIRLKGEGQEKIDRLEEFMAYATRNHPNAEMLIREDSRNGHTWKEWDEWEW